MPDKFCVTVINDPFKEEWPKYFDNFLKHCQRIADEYDNIFPDTEYSYEDTVLSIINHELKPHGKFIETKTQGSYLRWDDEKYHTFFLLRWS